MTLLKTKEICSFSTEQTRNCARAGVHSRRVKSSGHGPNVPWLGGVQVQECAMILIYVDC